MNEDADLLGSIIGEQLSSVEFVQDYVQLRFDGPTLTAFVWPVISLRGEHSGLEMKATGTSCVSELVIRFVQLMSGKARSEWILKTEAQFSISLRTEDRVGPEAGHFRSSKSPADPILEF